jgi:hypothetical protein
VLDNGMSLTSNLVHETSAGTADGSIDLTLSGTTAPYTFTWNNGETTEDISGLSTGTYFVIVVDALGCSKTHLFSVGVLTGLGADALAFELQVYPNPATSIINFELPENVNMQQVNLYDINGRLVYTRANLQSNKATLPTENLGAGMYFYTIDVAEGQLHGKVIFK